jgi:single-stranded-DNA-specific exonuclease
VPEAADRILAAVKAGRKIAIYGDYDADGMCATAILVGCLQALDAAPVWYVPSRQEEGYGLNADALSTLASQGTNLVVTVDCGITGVAEARHARDLGLELIITDHHNFTDELPAADVLVHPRLPGTAYPFGGLCGAGVAFKLAWAIATRASGASRVTPRLREALLRAIGLAAFATVTDVMPLVDENRLLVKHGLENLRTRGGPGLARLIELTGLTEQSRLESEHIAFKLGPRLNAAGRMATAANGIELLVTDDAARGSQLADYLHELNAQRETEERSLQLAAAKQAKELFDPEADAALVLADRGWHKGVVGIVAGVEYVNDSKATNLDAVEKALSSETRRVVLIAGGKDKGFEFGALTELVAARCRAAVLIGEMAGRIQKSWEPSLPCLRAGSLAEAVALSRDAAEPGDLVLFSPGTSSFDMFKNYADRGNQFRALVQQLF